MNNATYTQQIFARHMNGVVPEQDRIVIANVDLVMSTDGFAGIGKLLDRLGASEESLKRFVAFSDHHVPANTVQAANTAKAGRDYAVKHPNFRYFDVGRGGVCHHMLPEQGLCHPCDLIIGADSHTVTYGAFGAFSTGLGGQDAAVAVAVGKLWFRVPRSYKIILTGHKPRFVQGKDIVLKLLGMIGVAGAVYKALDFTGPAVKELTIADRVSISNMVVEMGAKAGIFAADEVTAEYFRNEHHYEIPDADKLVPADDDYYEKVITLNLSEMEPIVAAPSLPSNAVPVRECTNIKINQAFLGTCTNGRIEDMRIAAEIVKGHTIPSWVRMLVIPGTGKVYRQMLEEGLIEIFMDAGALVASPSCGPCCGAHMGMLADGEVCISASNRNFIGRMGSPKASIYLGSSAVVAASAVKGYICSPEEVIKK